MRQRPLRKGGIAVRRLVWFSAGFATACGVGAYLLRGNALLWLMAAGMVLAVPAGIYGRRIRSLSILAAVMVGLSLGWGVFWGYDTWVIAPVRALDGELRTVTFTASDFSQPTAYAASVDGTITVEGREYRLRLYLDQAWEVSPGDVIQMPVRLRFTDEGGAGEPTYHRTNGILLLGYQQDEGTLTPGTPRWTHQSALWRAALKEVIFRHFPEDTAPFALALLLGDKSELDPEITLHFRLAGLSHIVAVSGLHLSFFFGAICFLTGKRRFLTALLGIPAVVLFAAVAGFTPSVTRAAVMQILMMLALAFGREYDPPSALAFAVTVMLGTDPLVIASAGFQMSVGSVAGILLFYPILSKRLSVLIPEKKGLARKLLRGLVSGVALSLGASIVVTPLVAWYYGSVSLVSVLANLLVVPVVSIIFYGIIAVCIMSTFLPVAAGGAAWLVSWLIRYVFCAAGAVASMPLSSVYTRSVYIGIWLVLCYGVFLWVLAAKPKRNWPALCGCAAGLCIALLLSWTEPVLSDYRVTVLDVGQGQCILLQSRGTTFMVDCGGDQDENAGNTAAEALLSMGIDRIDGLILTHYDRDHCGGVRHLVRRIAIDRVYFPRTTDRDGLLETIVKATADSEQILLDGDMEIRFGDCSIRIFAPGSGKSGNESCAAVLFQNEKYDTLITGDMNAADERELLETGALPDLELLIVGHHGSATSTSAELLYRTAPDAAFISVGRDNAYGHPRQEILDRLALYGVAVYRTDLMGDLIFRG